MKRTGLETQHRTRRGNTLAWTVVAPVLVALAMLRGMMLSETPEAIALVPHPSPMRRATASTAAPAVVRPLPNATAPTAAPHRATPRVAAPAAELPERLALNAAIEPEALSFDYPGIAADLLHFVKLTPNGGGGFVVERVDPQSIYQQLGVQPGDVIYSIDPPPNSSLDVTFLRAEVKLEVFRNGQSVWLSFKPDQQADQQAESPSG